ncbi:MAG: biotin--[acetyl-CoA-carboxylase] ligase [Bacteroidales bacterium]|nr:biotin--[acetyl-CoA-carboxylase] ligase [Bacteroidales bacterium]
MSGIKWFAELDSTNNEARRTLDALDNFSVLATESQTAGRGQGEHTWYATPGRNLTFTVVLRPRLLPARDGILITHITTVSLVKYLEYHGVQARIKWPNDIWVGDKKICGILIENVLDGQYVQASIIGIGLNINEEGWPDYLPNPVSLSELTGRKYDIHAELETFYKIFCRHAEMIYGEDGRRLLQEEFGKRVFRLPEAL